MSSILKALKKLENESSQEYQARPWPQKINAKKTIKNRVKKIWFFNKCLSFLFVVSVLVIGGWFVLNSYLPLNKKPLFHIAHSEYNKEEARVASTPLHKQETALPAPSKKINPEPLPVEKIKNDDLPKPVTSSEKKAAIPKTSPARVLSPKEKLKTNPNKIHDRTLRSVPFKQSDESGLELQAIAWSGDPQDRIAVINGNIVREGGGVEGISVTHIGKDAVTFQKKGEQWKQRFRLK